MIWKPALRLVRTAKRCTPGRSRPGISTLWYFVTQTLVVGALAEDAWAVVAVAAVRKDPARARESAPAASRRGDGLSTMESPVS
jgi:hypothetical protein